MSQESLSYSKPKKFLKKGEGLKRFAEYNPPLPVTARKRRETYVKFNLEENIYSQILKNDSINLSTEIPTIPPPKIMHTPIRPVSRAPGALRPIPFNVQGTPDGFRVPLPPPRKTKSPPIPTLAKRSETSKAAQDDDKATNEQKSEPKRYNLRGGRKAATGTTKEPQKEARKGQRQLRAVVERYVGVTAPEERSRPTDVLENESQINGELDHLLKKIKDKKTSMADAANSDHDDQYDKGIRQSPQPTNRTFDLSSPSPDVYMDTLSQQIRHIQATANELKAKIKYCECGSLTSIEHAPTTRSSRRAASQCKTKANSIHETIHSLFDGIALLSEKLDDMNLRK